MVKSYTCTDVKRLDLFVSEVLNESRNQASELIKKGGVCVNNNTICKPSFKLSLGDEVKIEKLEAQVSEAKEVDFDVEVLFEDEYLLIINKPPFLTVHDAPSVKEATLVDWLKSKGVTLSTISGEERHGIVHRIDNQTSGALVVAKTNEVHVGLSVQLENKSMGRYYLALIDLPLKESCFVTKSIARNPKNRLKMLASNEGKEAKSAFCKLQESQNDKTELICAKLFSGRTHQIRAHLESLSRHILGDTLYGFKSQKAKIPRVMLHAYLLYFTHPITGEKIIQKAPLFDDFYAQMSFRFEQERIDEILCKTDFDALFSTFS